MGKDYTTNVPNLESAVLTDRYYIAVGRLLRACAVIDDFVTLFICKMMALTEGKAQLLLGMMPIRQKLEIAKSAASAFGPVGIATYQNWFDKDELKTILDCRNAMAVS